MKRIRKLLLILTVTLGFAGYSQDRSVKGTVLDGAFGDEPMAFVTVSVKGIDMESQTSLEGNFEFHLLDGDYTFVVDFIGYTAVEIPDVLVDGNHVVLKPIILSVVSPGYDVATVSNDQ